MGEAQDRARTCRCDHSRLRRYVVDDRGMGEAQGNPSPSPSLRHQIRSRTSLLRTRGTVEEDRHHPSHCVSQLNYHPS